MNNDLISRSALFKTWDTLDETQEPNLLIDAMIKAVQDAPAVDAEPVRHGRWILEACGFDMYRRTTDCVFKCSECGLRAENKYPYCHCGAKMDGGAENAVN